MTGLHQHQVFIITFPLQELAMAAPPSLIPLIPFYLLLNFRPLSFPLSAKKVQLSLPFISLRYYLCSSLPSLLPSLRHNPLCFLCGIFIVFHSALKVELSLSPLSISYYLHNDFLPPSLLPSLINVFFFSILYFALVFLSY